MNGPRLTGLVEDKL